jgi:hypothetical protein
LRLISPWIASIYLWCASCAPLNERIYPMPTPQAKNAYEAYCRHQGDKDHAGNPLPTWDNVSAENKKAWEAFAAAAGAGVPVNNAYNDNYLGVTGGKAVSGAPAPTWVFFAVNRADIAGAWTAAWAAARR